MSERLRRLVRLGYRFSVRSGLPMLSAVCLALLTRRVNPENGPRILFVGSQASLDDLLAMARYSGRFRYLCLERFNFNEILNRYLVRAELKENTYHIDSRLRPGRVQVYRYLWRMFPLFRRLLRFDAVISTNLGYLEQQELAQVCKDRSVPFIILLREGMVDPNNTVRYFSVYENKRAICDLFICYNETVRRGIIEQGVPGLSPENMKVSGVPRCDYYVREQVASLKDQLVVFTFNSDVKFKNLLAEPGEFVRAAEITRDFYRLLLDFAARRPDIRVVFKTKPSNYYVDEMQSMAKQCFGASGLPDNVVVTGEGSAKDLVLTSRWVVAIGNSTTVLESLLANRATGTPDFTEVIAPAKWDFLEGDEELAVPLKSPSDLDRLIARGYEDPAARRTRRYHEVLRRFLYSTDGCASKRAENYIDACLANFSTRATATPSGVADFRPSTSGKDQ